MQNVNNVTNAKPGVSGSIHVAPKGTVLPKDAVTALSAEFKPLGYISEDGLTNNNSPETDSQKAWGGDTVLFTQTGKEDTFGYKVIEALNIEVLKFVFGSKNVEGTLKTGITVKANSQELGENVVVVDVILKNGALKRIVIPHAITTEIGEVAYGDTDAVGYEITTAGLPDKEGNTHYEYIIEKSAEEASEDEGED